jgi:hypothetical protein
MKNYIGISRDHSISMRSIAKAAAKDYNETIGVIRDQAATAGQDTIVSVVRCGSGPRAAVIRESINSSISVLKPIGEGQYVTDGGSTPLFDSVGDLIEQLEATPDAKDPNTSFLVMAITDGEENSSQRWSARSLMQKIGDLQRTDRWTFVFRVPRGNARAMSRSFGVPEGNILEWDQTDRGFAVSTQATKEAFTQYYTDLKAGVKSTNKFYTNMSNVSVADVKANLVDISSVINLWLTAQKESIRPFCERMSGKSFIKGAAFYQLTKTEPEVQDYKQIVIRDKVSGAVYGGHAARDMLGLPRSGMAYVKPGDHGQYDIYIQSTSINRVLPPGTQMIYWPTHDQPITAPVATATKATKTATPIVAQTPFVPKQKVAPVAKSNLHSAGYISGYKAGFILGKAKSPVASAPTTSQYSTEFRNGYVVGYKDGRGKKKQLYK